jgi:hypothetical protein
MSQDFTTLVLSPPSWDALKVTNAIRDDADDHKHIALGEELLGCPFKGRCEALERLEHAACVLGRRVRVVKIID